MSLLDDIGDAMLAVVDAVLAVAFDPADQLRMLATMVVTPGGGPFAVCARRLSALAMAQASADYEPTSFEDALATMAEVTAALDAEITAAGDAGHDDTYLALRTVRAAVVADFTERGANLAPLIRIHRAAALPSLVVAQQLYGDAARQDELVGRVDPVHPAFMPRGMMVLAR